MGKRRTQINIDGVEHVIMKDIEDSGGDLMEEENSAEISMPTTTTHIKCDKCGQCNVKETIEFQRPNPKTYTMTQYIEHAKRPAICLPIVRLRRHVLTCPDCGYKVNYCI